MVNFPPELIQIILGEVDDLPTLLCCRLVNKAFETIANPSALKTTVIKKEKIRGDLEFTFEALSVMKDIVKHVKRIVYDARKVLVPEPDEEESEWGSQDGDNPGEELEATGTSTPEPAAMPSHLLAFPPRRNSEDTGREPTDEQVARFIESMMEEHKFIGRFNNLEALCLYLPWSCDTFNIWYRETYQGISAYNAVDIRLQDAILDACASAVTQLETGDGGCNLTVLELHNLLAYPSKALTSQGLNMLAKKLTSFAVSVYQGPPYYSHIAPIRDNSEPGLLLHVRLVRKLAQLMRVMENLQCLTYCNDVGEEGVAERWRQRCGDSVAWEEVFNNLRDLLVNLTTFEFAPPPGPDDAGICYHGYGAMGREHGTALTYFARSVEHNEDGIARDLGALRSLKEAVSQRRNAGSSKQVRKV
ncbi:hypothetical protein CPC08DRAFT_823511 [Agrocybe pediades]|nr:hypothetical protein CPC08DRAFT_823511 [Agrocybe pediades]